jgi:hypothetical protein
MYFLLIYDSLGAAILSPPGSILKSQYVQDILTSDGNKTVSRNVGNKSTCAAQRPIIANNFMLII